MSSETLVDIKDYLEQASKSAQEAFDMVEKQGEQNSIPDWMPRFLDELRSKKNYFNWDEHRDIEGGILAIIKWMNPNYFNEKDGEQKPADKVEPKFHEGEWTISNLDGKARQISKVHFDEHNSYYVVNGKSVNLEEYDRLHRLWTIQDAKDGDVLVYGDNPNDHHVEVIMIFKSLRNEKSAFTHFHIFDDKFRIDDWSDCNKNVHPATKGQRDLLFSKMKEAGYEWVSEKKELKKIEQKPAIIPKFKV